MPTSVSSSGYEGGKHPARTKVKPKKTVVTVHHDGHVTATGPEAAPAKKEAEASVKRVKKVVKATKTEEHNAAVAKSLSPGFDSGKKAVRENARKARVRRRIKSELSGLSGRSLKPPTPSVPTASARTNISKGPSHQELLELGVDQQVIKPQQEEGHLPKHKTVGQEIYDKVAEYGPVAVDLGMAAPAIAKSLAVKAGGAQIGEDVIGGSKLARALGASPEDVSTVTRVAARKADQQIAKDSAGSGVKAAAKRVVKRRAEKQEEKALAHELTGTKSPKSAALHSATPAGAVFKAGAVQPLAVVRGHEKAIVDNPGKVAGTTARALPGFITVPIGLAANAALTPARAASEAAHELGIPGAKGYSGEEIIAPIKYAGESQIDFAKQVAKVLTQDDSAEVQKAVEDELGLTLPIVAGLGVKSGLDHLTKGDRSAAEAITENVRRHIESVRKRFGGRLGIDEHGPGAKVFEGANKAKAGAHVVDKAKRGSEIEERDRLRGLQDAIDRGAEKQHVRDRNDGEPVHRRAEDAARYMVGHGINLDAPKATILKEIERMKTKLEDDREALGFTRRRDEVDKHGNHEKGDHLDTEDIFDALTENPAWAEHKGLKDTVEAARAQEAQSRQDPSNNDHSDAARYEPAAIDLGVPTRHERIPHDRREDYGGSTTWEEAYRNSTENLRRHQEKTRAAKKQVVQALSRRKRAELAFERGKKLGAKDVDRRIQAAEDLAAARKEVEDAKTEYTARRQIDADLRKLRGEAKRGLKTGNKHEDPALEQEMIAETQEAIAKNPARVEPEWTSEISRQPKRPTLAAGGGQDPPGGIKHRSGLATRIGSPAEDLHSYIVNSISTPTRRKHIYAATKEGLDSVQHRSPDATEGDNKFTMQQFEKLAADPNSPINETNFAPIPDQKVKRLDDWHDRGASRDLTDYTDAQSSMAELAKVMDAEDLAAEKAKGKADSKRLYRIVPKKWGNEVFPSFKANDGKWQQVGRFLNKSSNYLILQTSPAWALTQFGAEFAQAAVATPKILNPKYFKKLIREYHAMDPLVRREFETWTGSTVRDLDWANRAPLGLKGSDDAYRGIDRTKMGQILREAPQVLRKVDQWKGSRLRVVSALAKVDKDLNKETNHFLHSAGHIYRIQKQYSKELAGKSPREIAEFVTTHKDLQDTYRKYLDDMMGNWNALTRNEQVASQFLIFYPFLRMSLKWTFDAFPRNHPIKAAASYWLAQQNANELHNILGGNPSYFGEWGNVPIYTSKHPSMELPLASFGLSGNALVETAGQISENSKGPLPAQIALSVAQPALVAGARLITGLDKFTGEQKAHSGVGALNEALSLSPVTAGIERAKESLSGESPKEGAPNFFGATERQKTLDKLYAKLNGSLAEQETRKLAFRALPQSTEHSADKVKLNRIFGVFEESGSDAHDALKKQYEEEGRSGKEADRAEQKLWKVYDKASKELDGLFKKYGLSQENAKEEKGHEEFEHERQYGTKESGGSGDVFGELEKEIGLSGSGSKFGELEEEVGLKGGSGVFGELEKEMGLK